MLRAFLFVILGAAAGSVIQASIHKPTVQLNDTAKRMADCVEKDSAGVISPTELNNVYKLCWNHATITKR
ncbi:hypothetical protein D3C85_377760 [compost metagenome]